MTGRDDALRDRLEEYAAVYGRLAVILHSRTWSDAEKVTKALAVLDQLDHDTQEGDDS